MTNEKKILSEIVDLLDSYDGSEFCCERKDVVPTIPMYHAWFKAIVHDLIDGNFDLSYGEQRAIWIIENEITKIKDGVHDQSVSSGLVRYAEIGILEKILAKIKEDY